MKEPIPVLQAVDAAKCESEIIRSAVDQFYLLFSDHTAVLVSAADELFSGATVAVAFSDGEVRLGIYRSDNDVFTIENMFSAEKIICDCKNIRWVFPVLQVKILCVEKEL